MAIRNLTPHILNVFDQNGDEPILVIPPDGRVARVAVTTEQVGKTPEGVPLYAATFGAVQDLPEPELDTIFVVSMLVRSAVAGRIDLASPGELIRDVDGKPVGCRGLNVNR